MSEINGHEYIQYVLQEVQSLLSIAELRKKHNYCSPLCYGQIK